MGSPKQLARSILAAAVTATASAALGAPPAPAVIAAIDLAGPFTTHSAWRFTASQGPPINDPIMEDGGKAPGALQLCLRKGASGPCDPQLLVSLEPNVKDDLFSQPRYLNKAQVVQVRPGRPLLWVQIASLHSTDGNQAVLTQALAYRSDTDQFVRVYDQVTGRNGNEEVRYISAGPLTGDIISVEPTADAPFGFWVSVNTLPSGYAYKQVLRYRSATHYGDGNPLAVIDSEMPNIEQRLGVWRSGSPLPLPTAPCPKPHLIKTEL